MMLNPFSQGLFCVRHDFGSGSEAAEAEGKLRKWKQAFRNGRDYKESDVRLRNGWGTKEVEKSLQKWK